MGNLIVHVDAVGAGVHSDVTGTIARGDGGDDGVAGPADAQTVPSSWLAA